LVTTQACHHALAFPHIPIWKKTDELQSTPASNCVGVSRNSSSEGSPNSLQTAESDSEVNFVHFKALTSTHNDTLFPSRHSLNLAEMLATCIYQQSSKLIGKETDIVPLPTDTIDQDVPDDQSNQECTPGDRQNLVNIKPGFDGPNQRCGKRPRKDDDESNDESPTPSSKKSRTCLKVSSRSFWHVPTTRRIHWHTPDVQAVIAARKKSGPYLL